MFGGKRSFLRFVDIILGSSNHGICIAVTRVCTLDGGSGACVSNVLLEEKEKGCVPLGKGDACVI